MVGLSSAFTNQSCYTISGVPTEFVFQKFANKWFIMITQTGDMKNMVNVKFDELESTRNNEFSLSVSAGVSLTRCFGKFDESAEAALRYIIKNSKLKQCPRELIWSHDLTSVDKKVLDEVVKILNTIIS